MTISINDAKHVAKLARLDLSADELDLYTGQLNAVLNYAQSLQELDTKNIEPTYTSLEAQRDFRKDKAIPFSDTQKIIDNGPDTAGTSFVVPKIV